MSGDCGIPQFSRIPQFPQIPQSILVFIEYYDNVRGACLQVVAASFFLHALIVSNVASEAAIHNRSSEWNSLRLWNLPKLWNSWNWRANLVGQCFRRGHHGKVSTISENSTISSNSTHSTDYGLLFLRQRSKSSKHEEKSWLLQLIDTRDALCHSTRQR